VYGSAHAAGGVPAGILLWIAVSAATLLLMHATPFGARVFALGTNPVAARLSGVNVNRITILLYTFSGLMSGWPGSLCSARTGKAMSGRRPLPPHLHRRRGARRHLHPGRTRHLRRDHPAAVLLVTITAIITVVNASPGWRSILFGS
jgi:ribose transport system permease protein